MANEPFRVYRGGCWSFPLSSARVAERRLLAPGFRSNILGVRLVRFLTPLQQLAEVNNGK